MIMKINRSTRRFFVNPAAPQLHKVWCAASSACSKNVLLDVRKLGLKRMKYGTGHQPFIRRVDSCQYYHALPIPKSQTCFAGCEASGLS